MSNGFFSTPPRLNSAACVAAENAARQPLGVYRSDAGLLTCTHPHGGNGVGLIRLCRFGSLRQN